jgi:dipeptidyl aminopeptidase/acylaminoacyl peptidase
VRGLPITLSTTADPVAEPVWLPDSSGLLFTAPSRPDDEVGLSRDEVAKRARVIDSTQYRFNGRGYTFNRRRQVYRVHLPVDGAVAAPERLTAGDFDNFAPVVSPDGRRIAFVSSRNRDREWFGGSDVFVMAAGGGRATKVTSGGAWRNISWVDDHRLVALGMTDRTEVLLSSLHVVQVDGSAPVRRLGDGEVTCGGEVYGSPRPLVIGDAVYCHAVRRGAIHLDRYDLGSGRQSTVLGGDRTIGSFASDGARIAFVARGTNTPGELYEKSGRAERCLTAITTDFTASVALAEVEEFETNAADGYPVHGFSCRPVGARRGKGPALLYVHGGPLAQYGWGFFDEFQLAAAAGYHVIGINPRGSDGYGQAHASVIQGDLGGKDWADVQAAGDWLFAQRSTDTARVGIGGGSYGGFMTAWATGHSRRFAAALVERAVINWATMEATSDIGWFGSLMTGGTTLDDIERLRRQSPITYVGKARTPTLVMHSEEDWRCPIEQGEQWFAGLRRQGVASRFVRFPGENHELTRSGRPSLRVDRFHHVHDWFAKYLGGVAFER